jgi:hypothetical protein
VKVYRTASSEALRVITESIPIRLRKEEPTKYHEIVKGYGHQFDRRMEVKQWTEPANCVTITEGQEDSKHAIHTYRDDSKNEQGVGSEITILTDSNITDRKKYRSDGRCSNNEA